MRIMLDVLKVEELFENEVHQADILIELYKMVFPDWDNIESISGYPKVNESTWKAICNMFMKFDNKHHKEVMRSGLWLNSGFGNYGKIELKDWEVDISDVKVTMKSS